MRAILVAVGVALLVAAPPASASQLITRDAKDVRLEVDRKGRALVTYRPPGGALKRVLVWGAVDALTPTPHAPQVEFRVDFSGGWGTFHRPVWKTFRNACRPYDGPPLAWLVTACRAPDDSYWALQSWQRGLPSQGRDPSTALQRAWELRLSHWTNELARLEVWQDWKYSSRLNSVFGRVTYRGAPVYGFDSTPRGHPMDGYGRIVYYDSFNSGYGPGWRRHDSMLTHAPVGVFCAVFADSLTDRWGTNRGYGERVRITVSGPGVTPDVSWERPMLQRWNGASAEIVRHEQAMNDVTVALGDTDPRCAEL